MSGINPTDREAMIADIIQAGLEALECAGYIVSACDHHGREYIGIERVDRDEPGEFCQECAADGASGELCHLGLDSVAIEMAEKIEAALAKVGK